MTSWRFVIHLFLVVFSIIHVAKMGCYDYFKFGMLGLSSEDLLTKKTVQFYSASNLKDAIICTLEKDCQRWKNSCFILDDCFNRTIPLNGTPMCNEYAGKNMSVYHFLCLTARAFNHSIEGCDFENTCSLYSGMTANQTTSTPTTIAATAAPTTIAATAAPTTIAATATPTTIAATAAPTTIAATAAPTTIAATATPTTIAATAAPTMIAATPTPTTMAATATPTMIAATPTPTTMAATATPTTIAATAAPTTMAATATPTTIAPTTIAATAAPTMIAATATPTTMAATAAPTTMAATAAPTTMTATAAPTTMAATAAPARILSPKATSLPAAQGQKEYDKGDGSVSQPGETDSSPWKILFLISMLFNTVFLLLAVHKCHSMRCQTTGRENEEPVDTNAKRGSTSPSSVEEMSGLIEENSPPAITEQKHTQ